ncbi:MAG: hypothetical protein CVV44_17545 [Spirochaetae bacterium HGW-Spirochaetae-1]|jgi:DNA-binding GntR family transcriptional regulator|nr:MAG: hypothetical protein CVV44_17545 [Spirochaetae bacterium HGW-Spirochaetae-1]
MVLFHAENLNEQIAHHLREKIIHLELRPGSRLLEAKIAAELGVSRAPVREAIRILHKQLLVEILPRRGARVTEITGQYVHNLFEVVYELCGILTKRCIENCDEDHRIKLEGALKGIEKASEKGDVDAYHQAVYIFFILGIEASQNPILEVMLMDLLPGINRVQYASLLRRKMDLGQNARYFQEIFKAVKTGDVELGMKNMKEYIANERNFALMSIEEPGGVHA